MVMLAKSSVGILLLIFYQSCPVEMGYLGNSFCQQYISESCEWSGPSVLIINATKPCFFKCTYNPMQSLFEASQMNVQVYPTIQMKVQVHPNSLNTSVFISYILNNRMTSWTLRSNNESFSSLETIMCPVRKPDVHSDRILLFRLESNVHEDVPLRFNLIRTFWTNHIKLNETVEFGASPVSPLFKIFVWDNESDNILVTVDSLGQVGENVCAYLSVQNGQCPLATTAEQIITARGKYQSFLLTSMIALNKKQFPDGVFIIVLPLPDNLACTKTSGVPGGSTSRTKHVQVQVLSSLTLADTWPTYLWVFIVILFFVSLNGAFIYCSIRSDAKGKVGSSRQANAQDIEMEHQRRESGNETTENSFSDKEDWLAGFYKILGICALYVGLPFPNILRDYLHKYLDNGWEDTYYFNSKCLTSHGMVTDISRIFSNVTYLICGICYIIITIIHRNRIMKTSNSRKLGVDRNFDLFISLGVGLIIQGIMSSCYHACPTELTLHFDMMFMYIICIVMVEGLWGLRHRSISHHVYTSVGLVGSLLLIAEIKDFIPSWCFWIIFGLIHGVFTIVIAFTLFKYGKWSFSPVAIWSFFKKNENIPDIEAKPIQKILKIFSTLFCVVGNLAIIIDGSVNDMKVYKFILYMCVFNLGLYMVYFILSKVSVAIQSLVKKNENIPGCRERRHSSASRKHKILKIFASLIGVVGNIAIIIVGSINDLNVYKYILDVCLFNLGLYMAYYILAKLSHGEKVTAVSWICLTLSAIAWIPALVFYDMKNNNVEVSSAISHKLNSECLMFDVFDSHDLWHILSALGLFYSFVGILTLDDDINQTVRGTIPVF